MKDNKLLIRQAQNVDIPAIEQMYQRRVLYNDQHNIHQWNLNEVTWDAFKKLYRIQDYTLGIFNQQIVCGLFIVDIDELYWKNHLRKEALYLHKICVDPNYSKLGFADELIAYFIQKGKEEGVAQVRLDVREHKDKLRKMYERHGFKLVEIAKFHPDFTTALYEYRYQ